ncbi:MAG TPA: rhamnogalacturonan acetylesterase [Opitutaceae bacterium]|nr:rhamnogalacturonan acetylesterase [Opitutaceae bacterium]
MPRLLRLLPLLLAPLILGAAPEPKLHLIGDSTMANKPTDPPNPEHGWGQMLPQFFRDPAMVVNHAVNGRSTKSFIDEGRWQQVLDELHPGDYVLIQFGHNDEKLEDPKRGTTPDGTYADNLRRFVRETRAHGATPLLATPVARRKWDAAGHLVDTHGAYPDAMRRVAREENVPLLELQRLTTAMEEQAGVEGSKKIHLWIKPGEYARLPDGRQDDTHYSEYGATRVAALAVQEMRRLELPLCQWLK